MRYFLRTLVILICPTFCLAESKPIIVAADGTGDFKTVQEAIAAVPDNSPDRVVIHIKPGTYLGQIILPKTKSNVTFEGDPTGKSILSYSLNVSEPAPADVPKMFRGTGVVILGDDFQANNITFQNTSGDHGQALALRVDSDRAVLLDCCIIGWQDTLMVNNGRDYFQDCYIAGRVDFIYGSATAWFQDCEIHSRNGGHVTAANTPQDHPYGFVFMNCKLTGDAIPFNPATTNPSSTVKPKITPTADLGRPWRPYACVIYINCKMGSHIKPQGWNNWGKTSNEKTARYSEYKSTGTGAAPDQRTFWSHQLTDDQAKQITIQNVLAGDDHWDPALIAQASESAPTNVK
jgi:pectinesterase